MSSPLTAMTTQESDEARRGLEEVRQSLEMLKQGQAHAFNLQLRLGVLVGNEQAVRTALEAGAQRDYTDEEGRTILHCAILSENHDFLRALLEKDDPLINKQTPGGLTPIHLAVRRGTSECAQVLIEYGAALDLAMYNGDTPLHCAVSLNNPDLVRTLVDAGASVDVTNNDGWTPLQIAVDREFSDCEAILKEPPQSKTPSTKRFTTRNICGALCLVAAAGYYAYTHRNKKDTVAKRAVVFT